MICYPDSVHATSCPITEILFVEKTKLSEYSNYTEVTFNDTTTLIYKRDNTNKLPVTTTKLEASQPCISPYDQTMVTG